MNKLLRLSDGSTVSRRCTYVGAFGNVHVYTLDSKEDARVCFERNGVLWSVDFADRCEYLCNYLTEHGHDKFIQDINAMFERHKARLIAGEHSVMNGWLIAYIGKEQDHLDAKNSSNPSRPTTRKHSRSNAKLPLNLRMNKRSWIISAVKILLNSNI